MSFSDDLQTLVKSAFTILHKHKWGFFGCTYAGQDEIRRFEIRSLDISSPGGHYKRIDAEKIFDHSDGLGHLLLFIYQLNLGRRPQKLQCGTIILIKEP